MVESVVAQVAVFSVLVIAFAVMCYVVAKKQDDIAELTGERDRLKSENDVFSKRPTHGEYKTACDERNKAQGEVAAVTHRLNEKVAEAQAQRARADKLGDRPTSQTLQKVTSERDAYKADNKKAGAQILELKERVGKLEIEAKEESDIISHQSNMIGELKDGNRKLGNRIGGYEHGKQQTAQKILRFLDAHDVDDAARKFLVGLTKTRKRKKKGGA